MKLGCETELNELIRVGRFETINEYERDLSYGNSRITFNLTFNLIIQVLYSYTYIYVYVYFINTRTLNFKLN